MTLSGWEQPPCFWERPLRQAPTRLWCVSASEDTALKRHSGPAKHDQDYDEQSFPWPTVVYFKILVFTWHAPTEVKFK